MLNPDIKLIFRNDKTEEVFLKNTFTNVLSSMSEGEFEILENYANTQSIEKTIDDFREKYEIDKDFMLSLIQKAEEIDILLTEEYQNKKRIKKSKEKHSPITIYLIGFLNKISEYL